MSLRFLIVDDDESVAKSIMRTLRRPFPDAYCAYAEDGPKALSLLDTNDPFDVVISDFMMPGMNGADLLQEIARRGSSAAFILCSGGAPGFTDEQIHAQCPSRTSFVGKPFDINDLIAAVRVAMRVVLSA